MDEDIQYQRRFVLNKLPGIELGKPEKYEQGFISNPVGLVVRPRREGDKLYIQFKKRDEHGATLEQPKLDLTGSPKVFDDLLKWVAVSPGLPVNKDRYILKSPENKGTVQLVIDLYHGMDNIEGKILLQADFDSAEAMKSWTPPKWVEAAGATEVSGDARYNNEALSFDGWPS